MNVKISDLDIKGLEKIKATNILKAKLFYLSCPFTTKLYMEIKTKLPMSFIKENWNEITAP